MSLTLGPSQPVKINITLSLFSKHDFIFGFKFLSSLLNNNSRTRFGANEKSPDFT